MIVFKERQNPVPPLWFIFPGMGSQWANMARDMIEHCEPFKSSFNRCHQALETVNFNLQDLLLEGSPECYNDPQHAFIGICAIQVPSGVNIVTLLNISS